MSADTRYPHRSIQKARRQSAEILERRCRDWNAKHPVGTAVEFHPVIGEPEHRVRRTRTEAYVLSGHSPVLFLEGESGCVHLDAVVAIAKARGESTT